CTFELQKLNVDLWAKLLKRDDLKSILISTTVVRYMALSIRIPEDSSWRFTGDIIL
ncbi:Hypothetical protein FKW44_017357, partial [Caligus rogercresseyi]